MRSLCALPTSLLALVSIVKAARAAEYEIETETLDDGLIIEHTSGPVSCTRPTRNGDTISVNYKGTLLDTGAEFDESYSRGKPFEFRLGAGRVIKGWDEGLLGMCIGQSRKLTIPSQLAYGSAGVGTIPGGATLVFETHLEDIPSLTPEDWAVTTELFATSTPTASKTQEDTFAIATAPATPDEDETVGEGLSLEEDVPTDDVSSAEKQPDQAECRLLGPFALFIQALLGALALLTLVWKRWRETPKRPWIIFFYDVSKQVFGSMLTHVINLAISMLSSVDMANAAAHVVHQAGEKVQDAQGRTPNPCSFYLLNLGIDTTLGVPILWLWLKVLHALFLRTALARPPASIKSGHYGTPPKATWYLKQLFIYCIGLVLMKFCVLFFFLALPWLPWIGDWALRWTRGNEALEITFALFIFPLAMNAIQYWVIDNFIMDKNANGEKGNTNEGQAYQAVSGDDEEEHRRMIMDGDDEDEEDADATIPGNHERAPLAEANPSPIPVRAGYDGQDEGESDSAKKK